MGGLNFFRWNLSERVASRDSFSETNQKKQLGDLFFQWRALARSLLATCWHGKLLSVGNNQPTLSAIIISAATLTDLSSLRERPNDYEKESEIFLQHSRVHSQQATMRPFN